MLIVGAIRLGSRPAEVLQAFDAFRIALSHQQPLFTPNKCNNLDRNVRHVLTDIRNVIFTCFRIKQVRTSQVRLTATQCHQPTLRSDVR